MHWIITSVGIEIADDETERTRIGVGRLTEEAKVLIKESAELGIPALKRTARRISMQPTFTHQFRLLDDDDNVCYVGVCENLDEADEDDAFAPLDYAMADVGATHMQYRLKGSLDEWRTL